ncbi:MAG: hypothetical protein ACREQY_04150, partial [Candidatus Binatia bacterium]
RAAMVDSTVFLRAGSTGGAGVNMFEGDEPVPLSATVLYFDRETQDLIAYDLVQQSPATGRLIIQRRLVEEVPELPPTPGPGPLGTPAP